ncbi:hypothetical protein MXL54_08350 [Enterobacteriaceae bacterium G50]|nr:hypothetical protein [Enterobacteriaceae bacterium G50]
MAKKWSEVLASPDYQALSEPEKAEAQSQYFNDVVRPQLAPEEVNQAHTEFYNQYPVGQQTAAQQTQPQDSTQTPTDTGNPLERAFNYAGEVAASGGRMLAGGVAGLANAGVNIGNAVLSAADWATGDNTINYRIPKAGYGEADKYLMPQNSTEDLGSTILTYAAGGEVLAPLKAAEAATGSTQAASLLSKIGQSALRNLEGSAVGSIAESGDDSEELAKTLMANTAFGMGLEGVGSGLVKAGSATRRAIMQEGRAADAAREARIGEISDDVQHLSGVMPSMEGYTPRELLSNPELTNAFRKEGETAAVPDRLQSALKGMYGNESGEAMIRAVEQGEKPKSEYWQNELDANWNQPIDRQVAGHATQRLENEFSALERSRPEISLNRLDQLNQAYQSGSVTNPNIPIIGQVLNPAITVGNLSAGTRQRLGMGAGESLLQRMGEGAEKYSFGIGGVTRKSNQEALNKASYSALGDAGTMASRKGEGSRLSQQTLNAMQDQHSALTEQLSPQIDNYYSAVDRQQELLDRLNSNLSPDEHLATMQELNGVTDTVNQLEAPATQAQMMLDQSASALQKQAEKAGEQVTVANAYRAAAKPDDSYVSTRDLSNYGARKMAEAESLTSGRATKGYDESAYHEQQTPRQIQEAREETSALAGKQAKSAKAGESALLHLVSGIKAIPFMLSAGYSRAQAQSIMNDLARTGGKNLTADQLRDVLGAFAEGTTVKSTTRALTNEATKKETERKRRVQGWSITQ